MSTDPDLEMGDADLSKKRTAEQVAPAAPPSSNSSLALPSTQETLALPPTAIASSPSSKQELKRPKTTVDKNTGKGGALPDKTNATKSAASRGEDRRAQ